MKISGWFRRNNTLMAQAKDLSRQLQEAWDLNETLTEINIGHMENKEAIHARHNEINDYLRDQLHRVSRERYEERERRLAEVEHMEEILDDERTQMIDAQVALLDKYLTDNEEE